MRMRLNRFLYNIIAMALILLLSFALPAAAAQRTGIDVSQKGSITLKFQYKDELLSGVNVRIYKAADIDENGRFILDKAYKSDDGFTTTDLNEIREDSEWEKYRKSIEACIYSKKIEPTAAEGSDDNGIAGFKNLELGLYYVISDPLEQAKCRYAFSPFFISIPSKDENGTWTNAVYDVVGVPKCERFEVDSETVKYSLFKRWSDSGNADKRPESIEVTIYKDGQAYCETELSEKNNWRYSWESEPGHNWTMSEKKVKGYKMSLSAGKNSFTMTNTYKVPDKTNDNPPPSDNNPPSGVLGKVMEPISDVLGEIFGPEADVLGERKLPQTGQLWWPAAVLLILGIAFCMYGFICERDKDRK